jgi:hypothetical protein
MEGACQGVRDARLHGRKSLQEKESRVGLSALGKSPARPSAPSE